MKNLVTLMGLYLQGKAEMNDEMLASIWQAYLDAKHELMWEEHGVATERNISVAEIVESA